MSNVIHFLETLGRNQAMTGAEYVSAVAALEVDDPQREALLSRDAAMLNALLDGRPKVFFGLATPGEQPFTPDDDDDVPEQPVEPDEEVKLPPDKID